MNKIRPSPPWPQLIFALIVFIAVLVLAFIYQYSLQETVMVSILYVLWVGDLVFKSFDQRCIWQLGLVIALILSLVYSHRRSEKHISDPQVTVRRRSPAPRRIHFWRREIRVGSSTENAHSSRRFFYLRRLVFNALAYHQGCDIAEINEQLHSGQLQVPPAVAYVLGMDDTQIRSENRITIIQRIRNGLYWRIASSVPPRFSPDPKLEETAQYLEDLMEVDNDIKNF